MLVYGFWCVRKSDCYHSIIRYEFGSTGTLYIAGCWNPFLFVGEQYQYDVACRVQNLCKTLKQIIIFDPKVKRSASDTNSIYYSDFLKLGMERKFQAEVDKRTSESGNGDLVISFILLEQQESRRESCCIIRVMKLLLRHMMVG